MRFVCVLVMCALALDLPTIASVAAQTVPTSVDSKTVRTPRSGSPLLVDCPETVIIPSPLSPRPALRRATFASKPSLRHRHRHHVRPHRKAKPKAPHRARHGKHKAARHGHRHAPHRHAPRRAILRRVTYASPLCGERSTAINDMLGLPGVAAPAVAEDSPPGDVLPTFISLPPLIGGGPGPVIGPTPVGPIFPLGPGPTFPVGPGPIIIQPPGPPITPPVSPPVSSAPEPSSWATMLIGMMLIGGSFRRRAVLRAA